MSNNQRGSLFGISFSSPFSSSSYSITTSAAPPPQGASPSLSPHPPIPHLNPPDPSCPPYEEVISASGNLYPQLFDPSQQQNNPNALQNPASPSARNSNQPVSLPPPSSSSSNSFFSSTASPREIPKGKTGKHLKEHGYVPHHPVILIPGFASTGLVVEETSHQPWKGERVWLSLNKLEFKWNRKKISSSAIGGASENDLKDFEVSEKEEGVKKSMWVHHVSLQSDGFSDPPGIKVRPLKGIEGIDYLEPGALTSMISYVFGPVVRQLQTIGYTEKNMMAAPYDWRLPPFALESRDGYFTNLIASIEQFSLANDAPVVLACHSMGYKVIHYFLHFAKRKMGQDWIDRYVYSLFTIGAPFLGAPNAFRGVVTGELMGLGVFLSGNDATHMARSWGSAPWLFQHGLSYYPRDQPLIYTKIQSYLDITIGEAHFPPEYQGMNAFFSIELLDQTLLSTTKASIARSAHYGELFHLSTSDPLRLTREDILIFKVKADEENRAKAFSRVFGVNKMSLGEMLRDQGDLCSFEGWITLLPDEMTLSHDATEMLGSALEALNELGGTLKRSMMLRATQKKEKLSIQHLPIHLFVKITWKPAGESSMKVEAAAGNHGSQVRIAMAVNGEISEMKIDPLLSGNLPEIERLTKEATKQASRTATKLRHTKSKTQHSPKTVADILRQTAPESLVQLQQFYHEDEIYAAEALNPPPVKRLFSVYGINLETEMVHFYRRVVQRKDQKENKVFALDPSGSISGYKCVDGIGFETPATIQTRHDTGEQVAVSGDQTVPYCSLSYCLSWRKAGLLNVEVRELEKAEHREILDLDSFHRVFLGYLARRQLPTFIGPLIFTVVSGIDLVPPAQGSPSVTLEISCGTELEAQPIWTGTLVPERAGIWRGTVQLFVEMPRNFHLLELKCTGLDGKVLSQGWANLTGMEPMVPAQRQVGMSPQGMILLGLVVEKEFVLLS